MSFLDHIERCNNGDLSQFEPWFIGAQRAGFIHRDFAAVVATRPDLFTHRYRAWHLRAGLDTPDKRTVAVRAFLLELRERGQFGKGIVERLANERDESIGHCLGHFREIHGLQPIAIGLQW